MRMSKTELARAGERMAFEHLIGLGYRIVGQNLRLGRGELDLVAHDGATLVFVEVKTRSGLEFGAPLESVTPSKQRALRALAARYLSSTPHFGAVRFDCIGIVWSDPPELEHLLAAF
jgi:putative endonuclease